MFVEHIKNIYRWLIEKFIVPIMLYKSPALIVPI